MGEGRSGSTILSIILGNHPAIQTVGELNKWIEFKGKPKPGTAKQQDYAFWQNIFDCYPWNATCHTFDELNEISSRLESYINFPKILCGLIPDWMIEVYHNHNIKLFQAIDDSVKNKIIVDSSKNMSRAWLLYNNPYLNTKIIYLTRGPRATMLSYQKKDIEQQPKSQVISMLHYCIKNILCMMVSRSVTNNTILHIRYEDLMSDLPGMLQKIGDFVGIDLKYLSGMYEFNVPPLLDGNRIRMKDKIKLYFDTSWRRDLSTYQKTIAPLLTFPCSIRNGYFFDE